jgi:hypothetical protein
MGEAGQAGPLMLGLLAAILAGVRVVPGSVGSPQMAAAGCGEPSCGTAAERRTAEFRVGLLSAQRTTHRWPLTPNPRTDRL